MATLQRVKELRDDGIDYSEIPGQLESIDPGELVPYIDQAQGNVALQSTSVDNASQQSAAIELYAAMENRFQQMQGQIDRLQAAQAQEAQSRLSTVTMLGFGVIIGILLVAVVLGLFAFGAWVGG